MRTGRKRPILYRRYGIASSSPIFFGRVHTPKKDNIWKHLLSIQVKVDATHHRSFLPPTSSVSDQFPLPSPSPPSYGFSDPARASRTLWMKRNPLKPFNFPASTPIGQPVKLLQHFTSGCSLPRSGGRLDSFFESSCAVFNYLSMLLFGLNKPDNNRNRTWLQIYCSTGLAVMKWEYQVPTPPVEITIIRSILKIFSEGWRAALLDIFWREFIDTWLEEPGTSSPATTRDIILEREEFIYPAEAAVQIIPKESQLLDGVVFTMEGSNESYTLRTILGSDKDKLLRMFAETYPQVELQRAAERARECEGGGSREDDDLGTQ
ncbi:hypothetical protein B0H17DRAFT_1125157 [Mycena rosella]|uniref:Uncharacterized protein n=1 Tax=Mycena rosella TaxID=1033263 RepID=A0AAD7MA36_MYCRO|nr:hypothetical protein B0H17DRAFT_1125157 [Mycena rosella]